MGEDGDRLLNLVGVLLAVGIVAAVGVLLLSAASAPDRRAAPPETDWTLERVNDTHARIAHAGGEPVDTDDLVVLVNRYERSIDWERRLTRGEGGVVQAGPSQSVRLYWDGGRADQQLLASWNTDSDGTPTAS